MKFKFLIFNTVFLFNTTYATQLTPYAAHFCIDSSISGCTAPSLLDWKKTDIINQFYAQQTPLASPMKITNLDKFMQIIPFIDFSASRMPAQMTTTHTTQTQISDWQYLQRFTYFGGSQSEGQVLVPQSGWIKAAHQNGVKILGTIFFSPLVYGGDKEITALNNMLDNSTPYIKQLVSIAKTLGFDGYFINNETDESTETNNKFATFIQAFHQEAKNQNVDLTIDWYQVPANSASTLNKNLFIDSHANIISDNVFLDYGWINNANSISETVASWQYPLRQLDFGIYDVSYPVGITHQTLYNKIFPQNLGSVSEFAFGNILKPNNTDISMNQLLLNENQFWLGTTGWVGASHYVPTLTTISQLPFNTSFNTGQGTEYYLQGVSTNIGGWYDMGQQDLLPTWWSQITNPSSNSIIADIDYANAYTGGSSLILSGNLMPNTTSTINLYATNLNFSTVPFNIVMNVISKLLITNSVQADICMRSTTQNFCFTLKQSSSWMTNHFKMNLSGDTIAQISIQLTNKSKESSSVNLHIGHLFIGDDTESNPPAAPTNIHIMSEEIDEDGLIHHYVAWNAVANAKYYNIYLNKKWMGRTNQTIYDVMDSNSNPSITITAVNHNEMESAM